MARDPERHRGQREDRGERRHEDRAEASRSSGDRRIVRRQPLLAVLVDEVDEHDRVRDDDADEHEHADEGCHAERHARRDLEEDRPGRGERHRDEEEQRLPQRLERRDHHDVDDQDRGEHRETELPEGILLLGEHTADLRVGPRGEVEADEGGAHARGGSVEVVGGRGDRDGRGALPALRRDRGRPLALFDGRDLVEAEHAGRGRDRQRLQRVDRARHGGCLQVELHGGAVEFDGADLPRLHRVRHERADRDLGEPERRGLVAVDGHGDVRQRRRQVRGDLPDAVLPVERLHDGVGRGVERLRVGCRHVDLDVARREAALTRGDGHGADIRQPVDGVRHVLPDAVLVSRGLGRDGVGDARGTAGERVADRGAGRPDRGLHGLDAGDSEDRLLDLLGGGVLGIQRRRRAELLADGERVLPAVAEEVRLHEGRGGERAAEHEHRDDEGHPRVAERPRQDRQVRPLQAGRGRRRVFGVDRVPVGVEHGLAGLHEPVGEHGNDRQRDEQRRGHRDRDG